MNGTGLAFRDQEAAEEKISEIRSEYTKLLDELQVLNIDIDSLRLNGLIESAGIRARYF